MKAIRISASGQTDKLWYIHAIGYHAAMQTRVDAIICLRHNNVTIERSQTPKLTYWMILSIWNIQNRKIYRDRKQMSGWPGPEAGKLGRMSEGWWVEFLWGVTGMFKNWLWWWLYDSVSTWKPIKLSELTGQTAWNVKYFSIQLLLKKVRAQEPHLCL